MISPDDVKTPQKPPKPSVTEITALVSYKETCVPSDNYSNQDAITVSSQNWLRRNTLHNKIHKLGNYTEQLASKKEIADKNRETRRLLRAQKQWVQCCYVADRAVSRADDSFSSLLYFDVNTFRHTHGHYPIPKGTTNMDILRAIQRLWVREKLPKNLVTMKQVKNRSRLLVKALAADKKRGRSNDFPKAWVEPIRAYYFAQCVGLLKLRRDVCLFEVLDAYNKTVADMRHPPYNDVGNILKRGYWEPGRLPFMSNLLFFYSFSKNLLKPSGERTKRLQTTTKLTGTGIKKFFFILPALNKTGMCPDIIIDGKALDAESRGYKPHFVLPQYATT